MNEDNLNINTNIYSRQICVYGLETMIKLSKMKVFISGIRGICSEIAKNIILAGPKRVTIFDMNKSTNNDLTSNFYINEKDVIEGKRRDEASFKELAKLNLYV
jgi:ubiquitin-activating enzyme E1